MTNDFRSYDHKYSETEIVFGIQTPIDISILLKRIDCEHNILEQRSKKRRNLNFYVMGHE